MPCRTDGQTCGGCGFDPCACEVVRAKSKFDTAGALCDVLTLLEDAAPRLLPKVDAATIAWWRRHGKSEEERVRKEALAKLTAREKRVLGLK